MDSHNITVSKTTPVFHIFKASPIEGSSFLELFEILITFGITYSGSAPHLRKAAASLSMILDGMLDTKFSSIVWSMSIEAFSTVKLGLQLSNILQYSCFKTND